MRKISDKLVEKFHDDAFESPERFTTHYETEKYILEIDAELDYKTVVNKHTGKKSHIGYYNIVEAIVYDENNDDVTSRFQNVVSSIKKYLPDYDEIEQEIEDRDKTPEELYFGSYQGYLNYRYGNW